MTSTKDGWRALDFNDPELRHLIAREEFPEWFLDTVDKLMVKRGITRADLAELLGCSKSTVTRIMNGSTNLTAERMVDIAFAFGLELSLGEEG